MDDGRGWCVGPFTKISRSKKNTTENEDDCKSTHNKAQGGSWISHEPSIPNQESPPGEGWLSRNEDLETTNSHALHIKRHRHIFFVFRSHRLHNLGVYLITMRT